MGHALHVKEESFREYAQSDKIKSLVRELGESLVGPTYIVSSGPHTVGHHVARVGWVAPVLPQSMYM